MSKAEFFRSVDGSCWTRIKPQKTGCSVCGMQENNHTQPPLVDSASVGMNNTNTPVDSAPSAATPLLTERELAAHLRISLRHLCNLRRAGMPFIQLGSSIRYDMGEVQVYLKTNRRLSSHVERQKRRAAIVAPEA